MKRFAPAKLNLGLRVFPARADGLHPLVSHMVTIDWYDELVVQRSDRDELIVAGAELPAEGNILWDALAAARRAGAALDPMQIQLTKSIPVAAGLGGGSSDAAALLQLLGVADAETAAGVGSDVPFFLVGGLARVSGIGENVEPLTIDRSFAAAVVVPDIELSTQAVYEAWDELEGPVAPPRESTVLAVDLANDLLVAALELAPELETWIGGLEELWSTDVHLSGSGSSLFGVFGSLVEAEQALSVVPRGARDARAVSPLDGRGSDANGRDATPG